MIFVRWKFLNPFSATFPGKSVNGIDDLRVRYSVTETFSGGSVSCPEALKGNHIKSRQALGDSYKPKYR